MSFSGFVSKRSLENLATDLNLNTGLQLTSWLLGILEKAGSGDSPAV